MKKLITIIRSHMFVRVKRVKNPLLRGMLSVIAAPMIFVRDFKKIRYELKDQRVLYYVEVFLTPRCSLRCTYCAACMPSYTEMYDIPYEQIEASLKAFLDHIDFIENVRLLGGEPFCYRDLDKVVAYLRTRADKIGNIRIVTNGTIVPKSEALIRALDHKKVVLDISNYGENSTKKEELVALSKKYRFRVKLGPQLKFSVPEMDYHLRGMNEKLLAHKFQTCNEHCRLIRDGKLFYCGPSFWTLFVDGLDVAGDYVDLLHNEHPETLHDQIVDLYFNKPYLKGCDACPGSFLHRDCVIDAGKDQLELNGKQPFDMPPGFLEVQQRRI